MLSQLIQAHAAPATQPAIVTSTRATAWGELAELARGCLERHRALAGRRVGLLFLPLPESFAALAALDSARADVFLLAGDAGEQEQAAIAEQFRLGAVVRPRCDADGVRLECRSFAAEDAGSATGSVTILTSGTTGKPKAARHSWNSLGRPVRRSSEFVATRWFLAYRPNLYAGLQVVLQCLANAGTLVIPELSAEIDDVARLMGDARVQYVSATPSYWRRLLLFAPPELLRRVPLRQITLGGEAVDQPILDSLRARFPQARLVHIYATTELGRCFSVSDGAAGFPKRFLERPSPDGIALRIEAGELLVRSANAMSGYDRRSEQRVSLERWFHTGDLVQVRDDRVYFVGRKSEIINVGGQKVHPLEVERVVREAPGVIEARVYGQRSSIAGELVVCEVVGQPGAGESELQAAVNTHCLERLAAHQRPRLIRVVDTIDLADSGKTVRREC